MDIVKELKKAKVQVVHNVDGTCLGKVPELQANLFQYIIFNFPHSGAQRVHTNRALLFDFFESAREFVVHSGEIHVTLKTRPPYSNWLIEEQAEKAGLVLKARAAFNIKLFPGYNHVTTDPDAKAFEPAFCRCYQFVVDRSKVRR